MWKSKRKRIIVFVLVVIFVLLFFYRYVTIFCPKIHKINHDSSTVEVHMIDVGQSESILVIQGNHSLLIDTGGIFSGKDVKNYLFAQGIDSLDYLIVTHFHNDHLGGAHSVLSSIDVKKIICMDPKCFTTFQECVYFTDMKIAQITNNIFKSRTTKIEYVDVQNSNKREFLLGDAKTDILFTNLSDDIVNNRSIVSKLIFKNFSVLFTGDAQYATEQMLIDSGINISADVLKVGHHGSRTSTSLQFLKKVSPKYALISCGNSNNYLHPNQQVLEKLSRQNVKVFRTDYNGNIVVTSDGNEIEITTEK